MESKRELKKHIEKALVLMIKDTLSKHQTTDGSDPIKGLIEVGENLVGSILKDNVLAYNLNNVRAMKQGVAFVEGFKIQLEEHGDLHTSLPKEIVDNMPLIVLLLIADKLEKEVEEKINNHFEGKNG